MGVLVSIRCKQTITGQNLSQTKKVSLSMTKSLSRLMKTSQANIRDQHCHLQLMAPIEKELSSFFQQPDVDANGDAAPDVHPDAEALALADGGGQYDAAAIVGPIGPELFEAAPFPGQRGFSIQVSLQSDKVKTIFRLLLRTNFYSTFLTEKTRFVDGTA